MLTPLQRHLRKKYTKGGNPRGCKSEYSMVHLKIGVQKFQIGEYHRVEDVGWWRDMLAIALAQLLEDERFNRVRRTAKRTLRVGTPTGKRKRLATAG